MYVFYILLILIGAYLGSSIKIIRSSQTMVIERLGKYHRTLNPGLQLVLRFIEHPRPLMVREFERVERDHWIGKQIPEYRIDLRNRVYQFPIQTVITKDNVMMKIDPLLVYQISNPYRAVYEVANLPEGIEGLTQTVLRSIIGEMTLDETLASREMINQRLFEAMMRRMEKWGVTIVNVEIKDIQPPEDVQEAMEKQMRAERDKRAVILEAKGKKRAAILEAEGSREAAIQNAEGEKRAQMLKAEGEAVARIREAQAEAEAINRIQREYQSKSLDPANYLVALRYINALKEMVSGQNNKIIYLPYQASDILSSLGGIHDMFKNTPLKRPRR